MVSNLLVFSNSYKHDWSLWALAVAVPSVAMSEETSQHALSRAATGSSHDRPRRDGTGQPVTTRSPDSTHWRRLSDRRALDGAVIGGRIISCHVRADMRG